MNKMVKSKPNNLSPFGKSDSEVIKELQDEYTKKKKNAFNVPFIASIPVEVENKINEQVDKDVTYLQLKNKKTLKSYMDETSNLRKVANKIRDFFTDNPIGELSYEDLARDLGLSESQVRVLVSELARWENYPYVIVNTPKKKGYFQLHSKNAEDTEKWITTQSRNIASREQRLSKTERAQEAKRRQRKKETVAEKSKKKQIVQEQKQTETQ